MKSRYDKDVTNHMGVIFVEYIWNYQDRSDSGQSMMKMRQDNDVTDHTSPLYTKK